MRFRQLATVAILGSTASPLAAQLRLEPFDIRVPSAPAAFPADGKTNFTYELRITNIDRREVKITGVEVIADSVGPSLQSLDSTAVKAATRLAGAPVTGGDSRTLPSGRQTLLYMWVTVPAGGSTPSRLRHRISYATVDSANNPINDVVEAFYVPVRSLTLATMNGMAFASSSDSITGRLEGSTTRCTSTNSPGSSNTALSRSHLIAIPHCTQRSAPRATPVPQ